MGDGGGGEVRFGAEDVATFFFKVGGGSKVRWKAESDGGKKKKKDGETMKWISTLVNHQKKQSQFILLLHRTSYLSYVSALGYALTLSSLKTNHAITLLLTTGCTYK